MIAIQFKFKCPLCGWSITLPRRSQLVTYVNDKCHPDLGSWPIQWICIPHETVCRCQYDRVECIEFEEQVHTESPAALWEVECPCIEESCTMNLKAYTLWDLSEASRGELIAWLVKVKPKAPCSARHEIDWQSEEIKATMLLF